MDTEERKNFDNQFYNHQETMKEIKEVRDTQETLVHILNEMSDRIDIIRINSSDILNRYVDEVNELKLELTEISKTNPNYRRRGN
tara:strand:+ start:225 stop:479 length:255 start_codon:yes stop_codon:yes gene_type:complete